MESIGIVSIILIALGLSMDCFAVALGAGFTMGTVKKSQVLRIALAFGIFQALMPVIGWALGRTVIDYVAPYDHWVAFGLLAIIGGHMIWEFFEKKERTRTVDVTRGVRLLVLSVATSIDALAVGLSFAFLQVNIGVAVAIIGTVAFIVTAVGVIVGRKIGQLIGRWAELAGGLILIGIGLRILLTHLL
ncbi:MAG: manganese efflux pump [Dehalococcoidales bacterium]|nr:manganese efflux pump [Dehalococcoidales bacterium]